MPRINLEKFGLNREEEKTYLSLVKTGPTSVSDLSDFSGYKRTTLYQYLDKLIDKGLILETFSGRKKQYSASPADTFERILEKEALQIKENKQNLSSIVKRIEHLRKSVSLESGTRILHGAGGFEYMLKDILRTKEDLYFIGSHEAMLERDKLKDERYFLRQFTAKRRQKGGTKAWIITDHSQISKRQFREGDTDFREIKFWKQLDNSNGGLIVYGEKICCFSVEPEPVFYFIGNAIVAEILKTVFWQLWQSL